MKAVAVLLLVLMMISAAPVRAAVKAPETTSVHVEESQDAISSSEEEDEDEEEDEEEGASDEVASEASAPAAVASAEANDDEAEEEGDASTLSATFSEPEKLGWSGWLDLRPSWTQSEQKFHSENELALEYRPAANRSFGYTQEFRSNLLKAGVDSENTGFEFQLWNGYLWGDFSNVLSNRGGTVTLSYEPRIYLPTLSTERDAGLVFSTRQYLKLNWEVLPNTNLYLNEVPIGYLYTVSGIETDDGAAANQVFENRVELGVKVSFFTEMVTLNLPVVLQSHRYRHYQAEAENNDGWAHDIWINPELTVAVAENTTLGIAYYSDTLANASLTEPDVSNGLRKGVFQFIFTQSI